MTKLTSDRCYVNVGKLLDAQDIGYEVWLFNDEDYNPLINIINFLLHKGKDRSQKVAKNRLIGLYE